MKHSKEPDWDKVLYAERLRQRTPIVLAIYSGSLLAVMLSARAIHSFSAAARSTSDYRYGEVFVSVFFWLVALSAGIAIAIFTHRHRDVLPRHVEFIGFIPSLLAAASMPIAAVLAELLDMIAR